MFFCEGDSGGGQEINSGDASGRAKFEVAGRAKIFGEKSDPEDEQD
jgi:hypothetical protein